MAEGDILLKDINNMSESVSSTLPNDDTRSFGFSNSISQQSLATQNATDSNKKNINVRPNSAIYVPRRNLSRYGNAFSPLLFNRRPPTSQTELPIDTVNCFATTTFSWVNQYRMTRSVLDKIKNISSQSSSVIDKCLIPKTTYADSTDVNGKRLIGIYKYEVQTKGHIASSMFNVIWKFSRTRVFIASFFHTLSILLQIIGLVIFLNVSLKSIRLDNCTIEAINSTTNLTQNLTNSTQNLMNTTQNLTNTTQNLTNSTQNLMNTTQNPTNISDNEKMPEIKHYIFDRFGFAVGMFICYMISIYLANISAWLNLRTANRLRTACITTLYKKSMKSSIVYPIAAHQILSLANEESDCLYTLIECGSSFIGNTFGLIITFPFVLVYLGHFGIYPLFGIILFICISFILARLSSFSYRKSILYSAKKLTLVENFILYYKNLAILNYMTEIREKFSIFLSKQYSYLIWRDIYSNKYSGNMTSAILMGGLYLLWCDHNTYTNSISVQVLIILYSVFITNLILDNGHAFEAIALGKSTLDKLKHTYSITDASLSKHRPSNNTLVVSITDASFEWNQPHAVFSLKKDNKMTQMNSKKIFTLSINEFNVARGQIIGITGAPGSGKSSLLYSILGHTNLLSGNCRLKGSFSFSSDPPFLTNRSLKVNITMEFDAKKEFDPSEYYKAISMVKLNEDVCAVPGTDDLPVGMLELDSSQIERVVIARALYTKREIVLLDNPLNKFLGRKNPTHEDFLYDLLLQFRHSNKTVILTSQHEDILKLCDKVYFMDSGEIHREGEHTYLKTLPIYTKMLNEFQQHEQSIGDNIENSSYTVIARNKEKSKKSRRSVNRNSNSAAIISFYDNSEENLLKEVNDRNYYVQFLTILDYIVLTILYTVNALIYFILPFGFIKAVTKGFLEPWLCMVGIGAILVSFIFDVITKIYIAYRSKRKFEVQQIRMFSNLMRSSFSFMKEMNAYETIYYFSANLFNTLKPYSQIIRRVIFIIISMTIIGWFNYWTLFVPVIVIIITGIIYKMYYLTVAHFYSHELDTRKSIYRSIRNNLAGRAVLQSFDRVHDFSLTYYQDIQNNSMAIFIRKSVVYHASFLFKVLAGFGLLAILVILVFVPLSKLVIEHHVNVLLAYFIFIESLHDLLTKGLFETIIAKDILKKLEHFENKLSNNQVNDYGIEILNDVNKIGFPVTFRNIKCSIMGYSQLEIKKLAIERSEKVAIFGKGIELIIPLMSNILIPSQGEILIGNKNIVALKDESLKQIFGFVPFNPRIYEGTVRSLLTAFNKDEDIRAVFNLLQVYEVLSNFPTKLDEPLASVPRMYKQLLCVINCLQRKPSVLVIEKPHPEIQDIIDLCINRFFKLTTVIFLIGYNYDQFHNCNRIINLDDFK